MPKPSAATASRPGTAIAKLKPAYDVVVAGGRVIDPANASFMGVYSTCDLRGWNDELCRAVGAKKSQLPDILEAGRIAGAIERGAAHRFGLKQGTPMMVGIVDGSSAMLLTGAERPQDQEIESPRQKIERVIASHRLSMGVSQKGPWRVNGDNLARRTLV